MRGRILGSEGDTSIVMRKLLREYNIEHHELDIRDDKICELLRRADAVIHTAAQSSHPQIDRDTSRELQYKRLWNPLYP